MNPSPSVRGLPVCCGLPIQHFLRRLSFFLPAPDMSVCATNTVVFDARKVSHSRRKLADNERWAMLNKKTFQEILNALLAQSTSQPSSAATALTFALGQRSGSVSNKSTAPNGRTTMKGREYDFSGDARAPKDECAATSSNLESDKTSARVGCCCVENDDDDDYDLEIKDRCAREATDNLHSLPAASAAGSPFIIGLGGTGEREFILGQSNLAGVGGNLQGVGIFIVCAMPPSTDTSQYHFAARLLEGATATRNAVARKEECVPQALSLDAAAFVRTGSEAVSGAASESVARNALPQFRLGKKYENAEEDDGSDEGGSCERIDRPYTQRDGVVLRPALPVRNRSRLLNGFHPSPRSFDLNKVTKICSRKLCFSSGKPGLTSMCRLNPDQTIQVPAASESFTSDFAQTSTTLSTETSRTNNGFLSSEIRGTSDDSNTEIMSANATASSNPKHASAEFILRRGTDTGSTQTRSSVTDVPLSPTHVNTSCGGMRTEVPPSKDKTNVALPNRTIAPQGAAGVRRSEQSLSLSWSRWMAVDKDVLFCIIEHVLNAEAVALNSGFCFKTPAPTRKAFSSERPAATDFEKLPDSSWRNNGDRLHWAALFRSSQLGGIFEETGNGSCCQLPVEPRIRNRQEAVLENRTTENAMDSFVRVDNNTDAFANSQDPSCAKTRDGDSASVEISRCFAHFRLGRATVGEKQRHRGTGRRHVAANRKRKCFQSLAGSGFTDRAPDVSSPERETDQTGLTDDEVDRQGEGISREKGISSFKWKSKMMMRLRVESHRMIALTDKEGV